MNIEFNYYYGKEAEQFSFFKIPKLLFTDKTFSVISSDAKVLYGILLDRMSLSMKNSWLDEENRVFIIFTIDEIGKTMNIGRNKAINIMKELQDFGLIEKKRRGLGNNVIKLVIRAILPWEKEA
ncbi:MAG: replication initiator protein A, partial [Peptoanaerobacter stomatis]|uniref:replication initiator protein A n=1 Tax=Peptoanaerobacter stomatis TaxID=796937 RepID=UPI003F9F2DC2